MTILKKYLNQLSSTLGLRFGYMAVVLLVISVVTGCSNENKIELPDTNREGYYEATLNPSIVYAGTNLPADYQETRVDDVLILVFDESNKYFSQALVKNISYNDESGAYDLKFKMGSIDVDKNCSFVFLANSMLPSDMGNYVGESKQDVLAQLTFNTTNSKDEYKWINGSDYSFPMWGESKLITVKANSTDKVQVGDVNLLRAVARVDIGFNYTSDGVGGDKYSVVKNTAGNPYSLNSVYIYNAAKRGLIVPFADNYDAANSIVLNPSVPTSLDKLVPLKILLSPNITAPLKQQIYLAENLGGSYSSAKTKATTFVIGLYNKSFSNPNNQDGANIRYFRMDLSTKNLGENIQSVLRNRRYVLNIKNINGDGASTPDEAYKQETNVDVTISVEDWKSSKYDASIGDNGDEIVILESKVIELEAKAGYTGYLTIKTNLTKDRILLAGSPANLVVKPSEGDLFVYDLPITTSSENNTGRVKLTTYNLQVGNAKMTFEGRQATNKVRVMSMSAEVNGKYIKDWNIENPKSYNGKNEYIELVVDLENNTGEPINHIEEITAYNSKLGVTFSGNLSLKLGSDFGEQKQVTMQLKASGKPKDVGNFDYKVGVADSEVFAKQSIDATVVSTYRGAKILSIGDAKFAFTSNGGAGRMLKNKGSFGDKPSSDYKVQGISLTEENSTSTLRSYERLKNYDIVYISYSVDTDDSTVLSNLKRFINEGGFVVETNQNTGSSVKLVDEICNGGAVIAKKDGTFPTWKKDFMKLVSSGGSNIANFISNNKYSLDGKYLGVDYGNASYLESKPRDALVLGYLYNGPSDFYDGTTHIVLLTHINPKVGFVWCGDSGITSSKDGYDYRVLETESDGKPRIYHYKPRRAALSLDTYNAHFLYNLIERAIAHTNKYKVVDDMYNYI